MKSIIALTGKARSGKDTACQILRSYLTGLGYNVAVMAFADNLKASAATIFDLTVEDLYGSTKETPQTFNLSYVTMYERVEQAMYKHFRDVFDPYSDRVLLVQLTDVLVQKLKEVGKPTLMTRLGFANNYKVSSRQIQQIWGTEVVRSILGDNFWVKDLERRMHSFCNTAMQNMTTPIVLISDMRFDTEADMVRTYDSQIIEITRANAAKVVNHISEKGLSPAIPRDFVTNNGTLDELRYKLIAIVGE